MDKSDVIGAGQVAGGGYLAYKGVSHGLPRALGIRTEYHITSKENADSIRKCGNKLLPKYGGKNGWSQKVKSDSFVKNSTGYVHITGRHKDYLGRVFNKLPKFLQPFEGTIRRSIQKNMYRTVGNVDFVAFLLKMYEQNLARQEKLRILFDVFKKNLFNNKTKQFCIPGIDSYFNKNFVPDCDDVALKSTKPLRVYNNRLSAMIAGLKKFGLNGMKENKSRVAAGVGLLALVTGSGLALIKRGFNNITQKKE